MGVPQTLQNLSVGLATVPHCAQALMVRPSMPSASPVPTGEGGAQGQHNEVAGKSASDDAGAGLYGSSWLAAATIAARTTSRTGTAWARAAATHASNSGLAWAGPNGPSASFTGMAP